jgi:uncharacterized membrane protein
MKEFIKKFRTRAEELSDFTADTAAKPWFIIAHIVWWALWIGFKVEPFPFGLLTLIVSLEAIVLSGLLLSSGNREGEQEKKIARKDLRISTETNVISEEILEIVRDLQEDIRVLKDKEK